jgi:tRNA(Ile)-lysidine synthase
VPGSGGRLRLCRPLLRWRRQELEAIVASAGIEPARDPSNADESFDRARLRRHLAEAPWIDPAALARSAALLAGAETALEWTAARLFEARTGSVEGTIVLRAAGLPPELQRRLVLRCLCSVAPDAAPRGEALAALVDRLRAGATATLSGVKASGGEAWRFEAAPPRRR